MKKSEKKYPCGMAFGTFDLFHKWHEFYLREAKKLCNCLIVVIARDSRVLSGKGFLPNQNEDKRQASVANFLENNFQKYLYLFFFLQKISEKNFSKKNWQGKSSKKILKKIKKFKKMTTWNLGFAILGDEENIFSPIEKFSPEILFFGYDQRVPEEKIKEKFSHIEMRRIESFKPNLYKSSILREKIKK